MFPALHDIIEEESCFGSRSLSVWICCWLFQECRNKKLFLKKWIS